MVSTALVSIFCVFFLVQENLIFSLQDYVKSNNVVDAIIRQYIMLDTSEQLIEISCKYGWAGSFIFQFVSYYGTFFAKLFC